MSSASQPQHLSKALAELIAQRGWARVRANAQLDDIWNDVCGELIGTQTRVIKVRNGVLHVGVVSAALLSELASFHKDSLLQSLRERYPKLNIHEIKFRLKGEMSRNR